VPFGLRARRSNCKRRCSSGKPDRGAREEDERLLEEVQGIHAGGGFGSIIGRNSFQRPKPEAIALLRRIMEIYAS
jgi:DhnA family fructose-bisphosphate aldolase class Ia